MNILALALDQIDVTRRLRRVDQAYVEFLAASMADVGQMTPVEVRATAEGSAKPYALVSGAHRIAAAALAGLATIEAVVFEGSELEAELREIDENLVRRELIELDRATFLARRKAVYESLHDTGHGFRKARAGDGGQNVQLTFAKRFNVNVAERIGMSEKTIQRSIRRHTALDPQARELLAGLWIADHGHALDQLIALPAKQQRLVADVLAANPNLRSVKAAVAEAEGRVVEPPPGPDDAAYDALVSRWRRSPAPARRRFLAFLKDEPA